MRGFDYDRVLRGAADPLIASDVRIDEGGMWSAYVYAHNNVFARYIGVRSDVRAIVEEARADMVMRLMQRGANVHVCNCTGDMKAALKKWPAHVLEWIKCDVTKSQQCTLSKSSK